MVSRTFGLAASAAAAFLASTGCSSPSSTTPEAFEAPEVSEAAEGADAVQAASVDDVLAESLRAAGFTCDALVSSRPLDDDGTVWRLTCLDSQAYLASIEGGTEICMSLMPYGDFGGIQVGGTRTMRVVPRRDDAGSQEPAASGDVVETTDVAPRGMIEADSRCIRYAAG